MSQMLARLMKAAGPHAASLAATELQLGAGPWLREAVAQVRCYASLGLSIAIMPGCEQLCAAALCA